jgi:xanthine/CO dehydrogenase XdhC/CoxF family maturation factor
MTHHLDSDREHLRELAGPGPAYLGLLGPRARRERLLRELGTAGITLQPRLHGPVGLDIGADSPETIALAVAAEIQAHFATAFSPLDSGQ